jgi:carbon monoxide dehydrogenase subunit G
LCFCVNLAFARREGDAAVARYVDAIDLPVSVEEAFDYLADFSRTAEWDPSVVEATRLTPGTVRLGSSFRVSVSFLGRRLPLEYRITEFERPSRLVLSGSDSSLRSIDEITFVPRPGGTRVTYEARLELTGIRRLADPILDVLFQRIGRLAVRGLRERLAGKSTEGAASGGGAKSVQKSDERHRKRAKTVRKVRAVQQKGAVA